MTTDAPLDASLPGIGSFLEAIEDAERRRLLDAARRRHYEPGQSIVLDGETGDGLFVVLSGRVKMSRVSAEGREQVLRYVPTGGSFNEVPVFDGGPNPASATAAEPCDVLIISREQIYKLLESHPEVAEVIIRSLASRLRHLVELVDDLSFRHVTPRVARVLLQSIAPHPGVGAGADAGRRFSQRELAEMAGTSQRSSPAPCARWRTPGRSRSTGERSVSSTPSCSRSSREGGGSHAFRTKVTAQGRSREHH